MKNNKALISEDDLRTKIVYSWLKGSGLSSKDILIENTIKVQLGKGTKTICSRTDVLVKNTKGENLLIIEVKKPGHTLADRDCKQALSYARSLAEGGIAPFTILTNGKHSIIFDSISGEELPTSYVPKNHKYILNGFKPTSDVIKCREEALQYLISISSDNLLQFCKSQVDYRMSILKSDNIKSGKKYIPQLYTDRKEARKELDKKLFNDEDKNNVILIIGPPQHGKTCFACNTTERYLSKGIPCLFFPAITLKDGLINAIKEDFDWTFNDHMTHNAIIRRLDNILKEKNQKLIIFIDGWNEMVENSIRLNEECQRLELKNIQIVLTTTSPSLSRLLKDSAGNPTYISNITELSDAAIRRLITEPLKNSDKVSVIQIKNFNEEELHTAKIAYQKAFNVKFANGTNLINSPFYLRIAAEEYENQEVPLFATRSNLIRQSLLRKSERNMISSIDLYKGLNGLAEKILIEDSPLDCFLVSNEIINNKDINKWLEAGILTQNYKNEIPAIDFYYTYERDYAISIIHKKLNIEKDECPENKFINDVRILERTEAGKSSLAWFLSGPENVSSLKKIFTYIDINSLIAPSEFNSLLVHCILNQVRLNEQNLFSWLEGYLEPILQNKNIIDDYSEELAPYIYSAVKSLNKTIYPKKYSIWLRYLLMYDNLEELGYGESYVFSLYGDYEARCVCGYGNKEEEEEYDLILFQKFTLDIDLIVVKHACIFLACCSPNRYIKLLPQIVAHHKLQNITLDKTIEYCCSLILAEKSEAYFGSMCPGWLTDMEDGDEDVIGEFYAQFYLWNPILKLIQRESNLYKTIIDHLEILSEYAQVNLYDITGDLSFDNPNQINLEL